MFRHSKSFECFPFHCTTGQSREQGDPSRGHPAWDLTFSGMKVSDHHSETFPAVGQDTPAEGHGAKSLERANQPASPLPRHKFHDREYKSVPEYRFVLTIMTKDIAMRLGQARGD
jgi:hypothetical protein